VDEKTQIQAMNRTQPGSPIKKGRCGTMAALRACPPLAHAGLLMVDLPGPWLLSVVRQLQSRHPFRLGI
jgi:hypothetical protein